MAEEKKNRPEGRNDLETAVGNKESRKIKARNSRDRGTWFGLGMFGLVGWSVAVPTLLGIALGWWIDHRYAGRYSWTLMLLIIGVIVGCFNAWYWIKKESERDD